MTNADFKAVIEEKYSLVEELYSTAVMQYEFLKEKNFSGFEVADEKKYKITARLEELSVKIREFNLKNEEVSESIPEIIRKINLLFEKLRDTEKKNQELIDFYEKSISGSYIKSYKRIK